MMGSQPDLQNVLGRYMRDRRIAIDPIALGMPTVRRRTPGLRRDEVASRANISVSWYTALEQGRGGPPSTMVLDRLAKALLLTDVEREQLFLVGLGHAPQAQFKAEEGISARLQRILDRLGPCPAIIRTATWDVLGWNKAATFLMTNFAGLSAHQRNILRLIFVEDGLMQGPSDGWYDFARHIVSAFRVEVGRAGASASIVPLVEELSGLSPEFAEIWTSTEVFGPIGTKELEHPKLGMIKFESSVFAVDGRHDLSMVVYNPIEQEDAGKIAALLEENCSQVYVSCGIKR